MQPPPSSWVTDIKIQPDGKILVSGSIQLTGGNFNTQITRLNPNNTVDNSFNFTASTGISIGSFALQPDGKIVIGEGIRISRLNPNGSVDPTITPADITLGSVNAVVVQRNGKVVFGGDFSRINNTINRTGLARLNSDGTIDPDFTPTALPYAVGTLALQADGKILLGGNVSTVNGAPRTGFARLLGDTIIPARTRFDFDGDGRADLSIFRPGASAEWYWLNSSNNQSVGLQFGIGSDKPVPADYDGDGKRTLPFSVTATGIV